MSEKIEFSVKDGKLTVKKEFIEFIKKHIVDYSKIKYQKTLNNFDYFYTIINDNLYKAILSRYDGEIVIIIEQNYNSIFEKGTRLQMLSIEDGDTIYTDKNLALENIDDVEIDFDDKEEKSVDVKGESYWKAEYYQNIIF